MGGGEARQERGPLKGPVPLEGRSNKGEQNRLPGKGKKKREKRKKKRSQSSAIETGDKKRKGEVLEKKGRDALCQEIEATKSLKRKREVGKIKKRRKKGGGRAANR